MSVFDTTRRFCDFIDKSPTPFHVVAYLSSILKNAGFSELRATEKCIAVPGKAYFTTRNSSSIIAYVVGSKYSNGDPIAIIGAHTDSPCMKVKPKSNRHNSGYVQVGVSTYGGGIWHTWFDRDLTVAGRIVTKDKSSHRLSQKLVNIKKPILRIPNICIHLYRDHNEKFSPNHENHLVPILATVSEELSSKSEVNDPFGTQLSSALRQTGELTTADEILDFELFLSDTQAAQVGGVNDEFVHAPRIDNLCSCFLAIEALLDLVKKGFDECGICMVSLYDNEEVGSVSAQGAQSLFSEIVMRDISGDEFSTALRKSYLFSFDMAHAVHPNYKEKHEEKHRPLLNKGPVLKWNAKQRYATTALSGAILRECAAMDGVPLQEFCVRNDSPCGSTIGPLMSAKLGITTIDIGIPCLSMHSIRETLACQDLVYGIDLCKAFFAHYFDVIGRSDFM